MPRKVEIVSIPAGNPDENRDQGKNYLLTEMSAAKAEKWGMQLLWTLASQGVISPGDARDGMVGAAAALQDGALGKVAFELVEPLMDQMMECVSFIGDMGNLDPVTSRPYARAITVDDDIEEITTRLLLRARLIELHVNFLPRGTLSSIGNIVKAKMSNMPNTLTSAPPSEAS